MEEWSADQSSSPAAVRQAVFYGAIAVLGVAVVMVGMFCVASSASGEGDGARSTSGGTRCIRT